MREYLKVMKAAGDGTRTKILKMLEHRDLCVCEMQSVLRISQPSVSRHLRLLEEADLVRSEKDGMWTNFRLARPEECNSYSRVILEHLGYHPRATAMELMKEQQSGPRLQKEITKFLTNQQLSSMAREYKE
jgi:ArsR family transcriptional regulator